MTNLKKLISFLIFILLGLLIGFNIFLSFIVVPLLFSNFDNRLAGEIMNIIFPYYFSSGWIVGLIIYTLIALLSLKDKNLIMKLKSFVIAVSVFIISNMALHKAILPLSQNLTNTYYMLLDEKKNEKAKEIYSKFKKVHSISSMLNLFNLVILIFLFYNFYIYLIKEERLPKDF